MIILNISDNQNNFILKYGAEANVKKEQKNTYLQNEQLFKSGEEIRNLFEQVLDELYIIMNNAHSVSFPRVFWKILLGPWLLDILMIINERKFFLANSINPSINLVAKHKYQNFNYEYKELFFLSQNDNFNTLIFSLIINHFFFDKKNKNRAFVDISVNKNYENKVNTSKKIEKFKKFELIGKLKNKFINISKKLFFKNKNSTILFLIPSINYRNLFKINMRLFFKIYLIDTLSVFNSKKYKSVNSSITYKNTINHHSVNPYIKIIIDLMPADYLKNFSLNYLTAINFIKDFNYKKIYLRSPIESFATIRFLTALLKIRNVKIISGQHGGQYNNYPIHPLEIIERDLCDIFHVWGKKGLQNKSLNIDNSILTGCTNISWLYFFKKYNHTGRIVIIGSPLRKYYSGAFSYSNSYLKFYIERNRKFFDKIDIKDMKHYTYRLGWNFGIDIKKYFSKYKNLNFSSRENSSHAFNLISKSRLCIINYNSTTWLQLSYVNFPFLLFFDKKFDLITDLNEDIFDIMENNKILFYDAEKLYSHIKNIKNNVMNWWMTDDVQNVIKLIKIHYCDKIDINKFSNTIK